MSSLKSSKEEKITLSVAELKEIVLEAESDEAREHKLLLEMATIGWPIIDKVAYKMSIHGVNTKDRLIPHIHLDRADDLDELLFKFEISLVDMLATGEPTLVLQKDLRKHINRTNKSKCSWESYTKLHDGVVRYLNGGPEDDAPKGSRSNLESFVIAWNKESGNNPNRLAEYLKEHGVEVLDEYKPYFPTLYPSANLRGSSIRKD